MSGDSGESTPDGQRAGWGGALACGQHLAALALVVILPATWCLLRFDIPAPELLEQPDGRVVLLGGTSYVVAALFVAWNRYRGRLAGAALYDASLAALVVLLAGVVLLGPGAHRSTLAIAIASLFAVLAAVTLASRWAPLTAAAMSLLAMALAGWSYAQGAADGDRVTRTQVLTAFYRLEIESHSGVVKKPMVPGGSISQLGDRLLASTGAGELYLIDPGKPGSEFRSQRLELRVPVNIGEFERAAKAAKIEALNFRAMDVHAEVSGNEVRLFASHLYWHDDRRCYALRVSTLAADISRLAEYTVGTPWQTVYETHPCLPIDVDPDSTRRQFDGSQSGGRISRLDGNTLLVTVGDFVRNGVSRKDMVSQDADSSYGKIIAIDTRTWQDRTFSLGHRNAQGLHVDNEGQVWSTEHGPRGGDELNLVVDGGNYGWPRVTYGADYRGLTWPLNPTQGAHDGYLRPAFAWVPSIGISNLVRSSSRLFENWRGDLLVTSLRDQALWRVHVEDGHAMVTERIEIGQRLRDVVEAPSGQLYLWGDLGTLFVVTPVEGDQTDVSTFETCLACHVVKDGTVHVIGPDLAGVMGRDIAAAPGFPYSSGLRSVSGTWTRARLDAFLADPHAFAPGTTMAFPGIKDAAQRAAVLDQLQKLN